MAEWVAPAPRMGAAARARRQVGDGLLRGFCRPKMRVDCLLRAQLPERRPKASSHPESVIEGCTRQLAGEASGYALDPSLPCDIEIHATTPVSRDCGGRRRDGVLRILRAAADATARSPRRHFGRRARS